MPQWSFLQFQSARSRAVSQRFLHGVFNASSGFTLVELIVVIAIIAFLAMSLQFFSGRDVIRARTEVSATTLIAAFDEIRSRVQNGYRNFSGTVLEVKCFGIVLTGSGAFYKVTQYDPLALDHCSSNPLDIQDAAFGAQKVFLENGFSVSDFVDGSDVFESLFVFYAPPDGMMEVYGEDVFSTRYRLNDPNKEISFVVQYGVSVPASDAFARKIVLDPIKGKAYYDPSL